MAGVPLYFCPKKLVEDWWRLLESAGCQVEFLPGNCSAHVRRGAATVTVMVEPAVSDLTSGDMHELTLVFAAPFMRGKNWRLARKINFLLLGSGAKRYDKFFDGEIVYQCDGTFEDFIGHLKASGMDYRSVENELPVSSGIIRRDKATVCLWNGPAVDVGTGKPTRFIAASRCFSFFGTGDQSKLLGEIDTVLTRHGARRLKVERPEILKR
jgi:hypothetical protein